MAITFFHVALGGALGAVLRFAAGLGVLRFSGAGAHIATLGINVLGSFLIGLVVVYTFHKDVAHLNPFLMTGLLGGFTTFSAFSLEAFTLYERGAFGVAAAYVALSVMLSIGGLVAGVMLGRGIWA